MPTLTVTQIERLRRNLGDSGDPPTFSGAELQAMFDEANGDLATTVLFGFEALAASAIKLTNYTQNQTREERAAVFDHIVDKMIPYWTKKSTNASQIKIVGIAHRPLLQKDKPSDEDGDDRPLLW